MTTLDPSRLFGTIEDRFDRVLIGYTSAGEFDARVLTYRPRFVRDFDSATQDRLVRLDATASDSPPVTTPLHRRKYTGRILPVKIGVALGGRNRRMLWSLRHRTRLREPGND